MNQKVKKAIIPIAGFGVRFLPATKAISKELLPIVDKPTLLYNLEELLHAGVEEVVLVDSPQKTVTQDFLKENPSLNSLLKKQNREHLLKPIQDIKNHLKIHFILQEEPLGLGHAVLCAKSIIQNDPFALLLGDELIYTYENEDSCLKQLIHNFEKTGLSTVGLMKIKKEECIKYGMVKGKNFDRHIEIDELIEKPTPENCPSEWALPGRYVFHPQIFEHLKKIPKGKNNEYQLTDAMDLMAKNEGLTGIKLDPTKNKRYDAGDKLGYLIANIEYGLRHPEIKNGLNNYLKNRHCIKGKKI